MGLPVQKGRGSLIFLRDSLPKAAFTPMGKRSRNPLISIFPTFSHRFKRECIRQFRPTGDVFTLSSQNQQKNHLRFFHFSFHGYRSSGFLQDGMDRFARLLLSLRSILDESDGFSIAAASFERESSFFPLTNGANCTKIDKTTKHVHVPAPVLSRRGLREKRVQVPRGPAAVSALCSHVRRRKPVTEQSGRQNGTSKEA